MEALYKRRDGLTPEQLDYIEALLHTADEGLLLEIAACNVKNQQLERDISFAATASMEAMHFLMAQYSSWVPLSMVAEQFRLNYLPLLPQAKQTVDLFSHYLYEIVCSPETQKPQEWALDATTGQVKDLVVSIITALTAQYSVPVSIAIPATIILLKKGLLNFCAAPPPSSSKPKISGLSSFLSQNILGRYRTPPV